MRETAAAYGERGLAGNYVLAFRESDQAQVAVVGGKGAHLGELSRIKGVRVGMAETGTRDSSRRDGSLVVQRPLRTRSVGTAPAGTVIEQVSSAVPPAGTLGTSGVQVACWLPPFKRSV